MSSADEYPQSQDLFDPASPTSSESQQELLPDVTVKSTSSSDDDITSFQKPLNSSTEDEHHPYNQSAEDLLTELEGGAADHIPGPSGIPQRSDINLPTDLNTSSDVSEHTTKKINRRPADMPGAAYLEKKRKTALLESTRGRKARKLMDAEPCHTCKGYYEACGLSEEETRRQIAKVCRHRTRPGRSKTPPGIWDLEIKGTVPEKSPSPPRKRENKYMKKSRYL